MSRVRISPVTHVVTRAELTNRTLGHENPGPLSWQRGFVPLLEPAAVLPGSHRAWDEAAAALPRQHRRAGLRAALRSLPLVAAGEDDLPDAALGRAATVLGFLAHSYAHATPGVVPDLPPAVLEPWREVLRRLGRSGEPVLSYVDLVVANWRFRSGPVPDPLSVPSLRLLVPAVDVPEEHVFYLTQLEILSRAAPVLSAVAHAQQGVLQDDAEMVRAALGTITATLEGPMVNALRQIDPRCGAATHVDPVLWAKAVAPFAVPWGGAVLGPSGTASPIFALLDALLTRSRHESRLGQEILRHRAGYPPHWRQVLDAVDQVPVPRYVVRRGDPRLTAALGEVERAYAGSSGFLGRHRRKVFGYLQVAFKVGRSTTIGGFAGEPARREWLVVDDALEQSRGERTGRAPLAPGCVDPRPRVHVDHGGMRRVPVAELLGHNGDDGTWWVALHGRVVDVTGFLARHPGGAEVIKGYAGLDATAAFARAHRPTEALDRIRDRMTVGLLDRPPVAEDLRDDHDALLAAAHATLELRHVLRLDRSVAAGSTLVRERGRDPRPCETVWADDTRRRFRDGYVPELWRDALQPLAPPAGVTALLCGAPLPPPPAGDRGPAASPDVAELRADLDCVDAWLTRLLALLRQELCTWEDPSRSHSVHSCRSEAL